MAGRKFSFFESYAAMLDQLDDAQCAEFVRAMYRWAFQGEEPEFSDPSLRFAWPSIAEQITAGLEISERRAEAGKRSGKVRAKKAKKTKNEQCSNSVRNSVRTTGQDWTGQDMNMSSPRTGRAASPTPSRGSARGAAQEMSEEEFAALVDATPTMRE